jgi:hypothetical protein
MSDEEVLQPDVAVATAPLQPCPNALARGAVFRRVRSKTRRDPIRWCSASMNRFAL